VMVAGVVRQKSDVRPQVTTAKFECPSCGNVISVLQLDTSFKEPSRCGCGRKGRFRELDKELVDAQNIVLEEAPEDLEGGEQPKRINVFLKADLVSPMSEKRTNPGSKIHVVGEIKEMPIVLRTGSKSTRYDLFIEANYVEAVEETFLELAITEEEKKKIKDIGKSGRVFEMVINSIALQCTGMNASRRRCSCSSWGACKKSGKTDQSREETFMYCLLEIRVLQSRRCSRELALLRRGAGM